MDTDMNMDSDTTTNMELPQADVQSPQPGEILFEEPSAQDDPPDAPPVTGTAFRHLFRPTGIFIHGNVHYSDALQSALLQQAREPPRDITVKVHIRRPERDNWAYLGRAIVTQEVVGGKSNRIVVRSMNSHKILATFGEGTALQAEKRGNFVVVGCVEGTRVVSWSLNALNNSETLRLLALIELCCTSCKHFNTDPHIQNMYRRRVARAIKDDRRKRHKRRKDQEAMISAFARTALVDEPMQALDV
ncbi:unnamed protein product [Somion occarium]|uniref:Uncharacterized protein n=1 Tax=Somion occarium TaxID=3059160 RepID=A0ABP1CIV6_9APHY